jgi:23S rRNA (guanosine2251-2'-O)-methyltransferase
MYIEGRNAILESLRSNRQFKKLFAQDGVNKDEKVRQIVSKAKNRGVSIKYVTRKVLDKMSITGVHQGFIAQVIDKEEMNLNQFIENKLRIDQNLFLVYIRDAQYDYNIGAIIRSAECAGADGVILPPKIRIGAEAIRSSTGAAEHINIFNESLFNSIKTAQKTGVRIVGIEVTGEKYYYDEDLSGPVMFIVGGEDRPLSLEIQKKCDIIVKIPLRGKVNSLNMSVAAGIVMFEKTKQDLNNIN